ncbi:hypothetical protein JCM8097_005883 [Rhodosporidiobolus ruineniae]
MSFSVGPSSDLIPRASLDGLPPELKRRIIELCAEQDERFKQWTQAFDEMMERCSDFGPADDVEGIMQGTKDNYEPSVKALFELTKRWSNLTLAASKTQSPVFQYLVAPRRAKLFKRLELDDAPAAVLSSLIPQLPHFPNLREVVFKQHALDAVLGPAGSRRPFLHDYSAAAPFVADLLLRLLEPVTSLHLYLRRDQQVEDLVVHSPALRNLVIDLSTLSAAAATLQRTLETAPTLQSLEILTDPDVPSLGIDLRAAVPSCGPAPLLTSLRFSGHSPPTSFFVFAASFSASLAVLEVHTTHLRAPAPFASLAYLSFPSVTSLQLSGDYHNLKNILSSLTTTAFPSLAGLTLNASGMPNVEIEMEPFPTLFHHANSLPRRLRNLHLFDLVYPFTPQERNFLHDWGKRHDVEIVMDPVKPFPSLQLISAEIEDGERPVEQAELFSSVDRTADFLAAWHARVREEPTQEEYTRLAGVLRPAEFARVMAET